ncbi:chromate efflux transporter [Reichenbachiella sp.]|uniref:chromate efflux transporter n=2 Tax=Reichenbachiella sp. TaxID=2184521 RepID=UPI0032977FA5
MSETNEGDKISMFYLFRTFLKIGSLSFGGFMALIAVVQRQMVEKDRKLDDQVLLDGVSLASILPGPLAVNTVGYVGYQLRGFWGALLSMLAVTLPCFLIVLLFSMAYFEYGELTLFKSVITWVIPAIVVIIVTVGISMSKKHLQDWKQYLITLASFIAFQWLGGIWTTFSVMLLGAGLGLAFYKTSEQGGISKSSESSSLNLVKNMAVLVLLSTVGILSIYLFQTKEMGLISTKVLAVFSSMSLTLFGGGYVIIPIIQETIVASLGWLGLEEFNTALAISQVTPGPILISATFIGYKVAGIPGACLATVGIFLPSGLLMVSCSQLLNKYKNLASVKAIFRGLRPAVIGLIFSAALTIGYESLLKWQSAVAFGLLLTISIFFRTTTLWVIAIAIALGSVGTLI